MYPSRVLAQGRCGSLEQSQGVGSYFLQCRPALASVSPCRCSPPNLPAPQLWGVYASPPALCPSIVRSAGTVGSKAAARPRLALTAGRGRRHSPNLAIPGSPPEHRLKAIADPVRLRLLCLVAARQSSGPSVVPIVFDHVTHDLGSTLSSARIFDSRVQAGSVMGDMITLKALFQSCCRGACDGGVAVNLTVDSSEPFEGAPLRTRRLVLRDRASGPCCVSRRRRSVVGACLRSDTACPEQVMHTGRHGDQDEAPDR